jgi:tetratricopeptide (TPR) repeat protein
VVTQPSNQTIDTDVLREISAAVGASDFAKAAGLADGALKQGMAHPALFNARALRAQHEGRHEEALAEFQRAFAFTPKDVALLNAIGLCLVRLNRADEAIALFESAIRIAPAFAPTHFRKGWAHAANGDYDLARTCYERAVRLQPNYAEAIAGLSWIAARNGDTEKARIYGERALRLDPRQPTATGAIARIEVADGSFEQAERRLEPLLAHTSLDAQIKATLTGYFADALDGQGRIDEAFAAYTASNSALRALHAARFDDRNRLSRRASNLIDWLEDMSTESWTGGAAHEVPEEGPREHIFLLGFMRSGTTFLEQALATHPDVTSLEERDTLSPLGGEFLSDFQGVARLASLSHPERARASQSYWARVKSFGIDARSKVFIDKQPLATINLPLIATLFPSAKILLALRDPRDVVFSCFRRHFDVGPATFELLDLEDAARFYDIAMRLAQTCREKMTIAVLEHRYEDMVENIEQHVRAVCRFAGIDWLETMGDFQRRDQPIRSASAAQIRRGFSLEGVGQWRRYRKHLEPVLPILAPWVRRFGYADD